MWVMGEKVYITDLGHSDRLSRLTLCQRSARLDSNFIFPAENNNCASFEVTNGKLSNADPYFTNDVSFRHKVKLKSFISMTIK